MSLEEFSLAQQLGAGETRRAVDVALSVLDGRSAKTLVNATPIRRTEGDAAGSVVVTIPLSGISLPQEWS